MGKFMFKTRFYLFQHRKLIRHTNSMVKIDTGIGISVPNTCYALKKINWEASFSVMNLIFPIFDATGATWPRALRISFWRYDYPDRWKVVSRVRTYVENLLDSCFRSKKMISEVLDFFLPPISYRWYAGIRSERPGNNHNFHIFDMKGRLLRSQ